MCHHLHLFVASRLTLEIFNCNRKFKITEFPLLEVLFLCNVTLQKSTHTKSTFSFWFCGGGKLMKQAKPIV